ncbi:MAG TPA: bifunctional chorismate mutase/prephenate dehydrogenase [Leptolyngbyaceae cyanobacterium]
MSIKSSIDVDFTSVNNVKSRQITIIGGRGRMGQLFAEQLLAIGHKVNVLGNQDWDYADQLLSQAELVIVSVPIECTVDVIKRAAKYLSSTTALCDITSIKTQPTQAMLTHHQGPVMGLHPMFGPSVKSFSGQKIVVCPGRHDESFQWLLDVMQNQGGELITCTPEEHDQIMVFVQATQHFYRLSLGVFLAEANIDLERSLLMSSPSYRQEIEILKRLFKQNPNLCVDIILATEERCQAINDLAETYQRLAELVARKDREGLIKEFEEHQAFFQQQDNSLVPATYTFTENKDTGFNRFH